MQREDVERLAASLRENSWGVNVTDTLERWVREREEAADLIAALLAERDAAFAAGQEDRDAMVEAIQDTLLGMNVWPDAGTEAVARAAADDLLTKGWRRRVKGGEA